MSPIYLKALEIQGFKSFPDKTVLDFGEDITAIVGPNGSGKSNISDAIRWVMGEQNSRQLRGAKMEDVIFGGTETRNQMGFAQVTLVIDNTEHIFPTRDEAEVAVTRRYYRSGESEYYINKQSVRLKDVNELFMDTGMGREGYSIIGQGKIDEILSVKSGERREIFEEAAGISKYRHRKEESERKLERTQENLVRLHKRGRMLVAPYEAIRFQRLDLFAVTLRQIGAYMGRMHLEDAVKVLKDGDGNNNAAKVYEVGSNPIGGSKGALSYDVLLDFWAQFDPYTMNTMLVSNDMMLAMLKLSEFQNPNTGLNFQATGKLTTPLGAKLLRSSAVPSGTIIGLDKNYALEQICGSEITVEYDKLIDRQLERAAITSISGFAKLFTEASKVLVV